MERKTLRFRWLANSLFLLGITMVLFVGSFRYLSAFVKDVGQRNSRIRLAESLGAVCSTKTSRDQQSCEIAVPREPAPYCCPPLNFARTRVVLEPSVERFMKSPERGPGIWIQPVDVNGVTDWTPADDRVKPTESMSPGTSGTYPLARSIARILFGLEPMISWADKPFEVKTRSVERK